MRAVSALDFRRQDVHMAMKKRYVKRLVRKVILYLMVIVTVSLVTTMIVERRMRKSEEAEEKLDPNGDPITPVFRAANIHPTRKAPRPPYQDRNSVVELPKSEKRQGFQLPEPKGERKDWHDYAAMEADRKRTGLGEHGEAGKIENPEEKHLETEIYEMNGFNGLLSDRISVNRSVPDVRLEACKSRKYLAKLPDISVVFIFFNEHFNTLLRSIYSVINRTPPELLKQIVLVDDGSEWENLKKPLDDYVEKHFPHLVTVVRNPERRGLIGARIAGAKVAIGKVMVFFDSHIEVNYNWLPPLIEPIAINPKISTCPIVDVIMHGDFSYSGGYQTGARGGFDWKFYYKQLPVLPEDAADNSMPYRSPVMMGGLFAINTDFFWNLGGYDDQLDIWGGEQYELSFKIWMCGGMLLDVPCSRVAHIFRGPMKPRGNPRGHNFVAKNHKRVAEVWMDEYKEYVYTRDPETYKNLDAGDLTRQKAIREQLKCKSFHWYMTEVAADFLEKFPPVEPPSYASGAIQNLANPIYCLDNMGNEKDAAVGMFSCADNKTHPQHNQFWELSIHRDLRMKNFESVCLDAHEPLPNTTVWLWNCHSQGGNQFWYYDRDNQWLVHGESGDRCLEGFVENGNAKVVLNRCERNNDRQRWQFGFVNHTMMDDFYKGLK
ncbi:LOW QUALITY PROTEIN: N-acetylgalactosaminyltransferase 4 [Drosophila eugracilis]|uniref:LOW QUALITY PROTEIN: N-acetylgalactosaminyltransferase 4 n=1 Tax=Drosophila eugracilis TaxID=29029 RepID=UPI001BDA295A|nr:LOW QUALITY PROTEIN: N-acetylgalactosaminyltransferase 4 [Drosophila eugracilis]